jgi:hypothetical protein
MKPFTLLSISTSLLVALLASCNPTRTIIADDLYYQRPSDLAIGEDPNDPTSYAAFKDRQQANKQAQLFESNKGTSTRSFYRNNTFFNSNFQNQGMNAFGGNTFFSPFIFKPYRYWNNVHFGPFGSSNLGWSNMNPNYNVYGYNQWGQYTGYNYAFGNGYGNYFNGGYNPYFGYNSPSYLKPSIYTTISGPRGGYNTLTGNRDAGGGAKYRSSSANTAGNNTSTAVRVNASSLARSGSNSIVKNNDRNTTSSPSIKAENRPMGSDGRSIKPKTYETRPSESHTSRPADSNKPTAPQLSRPRETGSGSGRSQPSSPTRSTPSKSGGGAIRSGGRG